MSLLIASIAIWTGRVQDQLFKLTELTQKVHLAIKDTEKLQRDFFSRETINPNFYESNGKSPLVIQTKAQLDQVQQDLQTLNEMARVQSLRLDDKIIPFQGLIENYETLFDSLVRLTQTRGFKDYGLEGQMRGYIHALENAPFTVDMVLLLMIRRHEKDFILRKEEQYIRKLTDKVEQLRKSTAATIPNPKDRAYYDSLLVNYKAAFIKLTLLEEQIGYHNQDGLKSRLPEQTADMDVLIGGLVAEVNRHAEGLRQRSNYIFLSALVLSVILGVILAFFVVNKLGKPIERLSASINEVIENDFRGEIGDKLSFKTNDEITLLANDFKYMLARIQERTAELEQQKEEIHTQAESLRAANVQIQRKNQNIVSSINYAKRIQDAVLPDEQTRLRLLPDSFIFYMPRDIVSGDFYWLEEVQGKTIIAAADCTGHGVPGALMSILGINAFRNILLQDGILQPDQILNLLNQRIRTVLRQETTAVHDGMDIALCVWDPERRVLQYAGAKNPLLLIRNGKMNVFRADRAPIGGLPKEHRHPYTLHEIALQAHDQLYLHSDGYPDQFGGGSDRKILSKHFRELLLQNAHLPMDAQGKALDDFLQTWMDNTRQIDDIMVMGFKLC